MARRGSTKRLSVDQEDLVARLYGGSRSPSSGAAAHDGGDIRLEEHLAECKLKGGPGNPVDPLPVFVRDLEKVVDEAAQEGKDAFLIRSYYAPTSNLSDHTGWIHLAIRQMDLDVADFLEAQEANV